MERESFASNAYFEPLGIKASLERAVRVFRCRWKHLLLVSTIPIFAWYIVAIGIRKGFELLSASQVHYQSFNVAGTTVTYPWEHFRATFSKLGLVVEFLLFSFLYLPADAAIVRIVAVLYAEEEQGDDVEVVSGVRRALRAVSPKLPSLGQVCAVWCAVLALPLVLFVLAMAPEDETARYGLQIYDQEPWKLALGFIYLIASSAFMLATSLSYSILTIKGGQAMASLKESFELFKKSWSHIGAVTSVWFLVKIAVTKFVTAINWLVYQYDKNVWAVWDQPGIPLHPIRILWSTSNDLWEIGTSWISVPFVILLATMGSVLRAVLYMDTRIKQEGYSRDLLRSEIVLDESEEANDYNNMEMNGVAPTSGLDNSEGATDYKNMEENGAAPTGDGTLA